MKKLLLILISYITLLQATDMSEIKHLSQKIAFEYLSYYANTKNTLSKDDISKDIASLEERFREAAKRAEDDRTKDILNFLSYSKDEIKDIVEKEPDNESVVKILDITSNIYEGASSSTEQSAKTDIYKILKEYLTIKLGIERYDEKELKNDFSNLTTDANGKSLTQISKIINDDTIPFIPNILYLLVKDMESEI
jgi:formyltetrahydrofolate hydrolase